MWKVARFPNLCSVFLTGAMDTAIPTTFGAGEHVDAAASIVHAFGQFF
jgi:hypothetical protein